MPRVSQIMTVRNGEQFLADALHSLSAQSFTDTEIVVVNNGSTDGTARILDEFNYPRLKVISVHPKLNSTFASGISKAFNAATGDFISVQDSDDISDKNRIQKQVQLLENRPDIGLVGTSVEWINENGNHLFFYSPPVQSANLMQQYAWMNPLAHSSVMFRRSLASQFGGYNTRYSLACDYRMALDILYAGGKICSIGEPLVKMRQHNNQESKQPGANILFNQDFLNLLKYAQDLPFLTRTSHSKGQHHITKAKFRLALNLIQAEKIGDGIKLFGEVILESPFSIFAYVIAKTFREQLRKIT